LRLEDAFEPLRDAVRNALKGADAVVVIGGDNGVTRPGGTSGLLA
jgi:molybdopterin biosynthesis enzyme